MTEKNLKRFQIVFSVRKRYESVIEAYSEKDIRYLIRDLDTEQLNELSDEFGSEEIEILKELEETE